MNNENQNRSGHARRRPEQITKKSANAQSANRYSAGTSRAVVQHGDTQGKRGSALPVSKDDRKKQKAIEKQRKRIVGARKKERIEAEWQKDIVRVRGGVDGAMLAIILILLALGSICVFSASYPEAVRKTGDGMTYIRSQIVNVILGLIVMTFVACVPMQMYRSWLPLFVYGLAAVLLIVVLFYGTVVGVTKRWIPIGPINVQPSEIMKVGMILTLAWYFDKYDKQVNDISVPTKVQYRWNTLYPLAILGVSCFLVLMGKHLSGTIIIGFIGLLMLIVGGCKIGWLLKTGLPIAIPAGIVYLITNPYALKRFTTFTDENADKLDELYQTTQSIYAIGSGGLFGVGLGESRQKFSYLSAAHTDFIFAIWCEEWGFIGAVTLIVLFLLFMWRGYVIALRAPDKFTMLTAFGITTHVGVQAFFNMCVVTDIFPNTGITLPFFSYGGSSLIVVLFEMGMLLAISRQYYRKKSELRKK